MNILIISQHFYPEEFRINEIARELVDKGNNVEVITGLPNYPQGEVYDGYKDKFEEEYFGVIIHRTKIRPRHSGSLNLFRNYMSFMFNAKKSLKRIKNNIDIVFCFQTSPVFQIRPAVFAKKKFNCPLITMCCDQWPESLNARGLSKGIAFNIISNYCTRLYNKCDFILNVAPSFIDYNNKVNKVPLNKMDWTIQHSEDSFSNVDTSKVSTKNKTVDLLFAGNIGKVQNVKDIILAYNELKYKDLNIHILGNGSEYDECNSLIEELKLHENVIMYGRIPNSEMINYYRKCDACLLTLSGKTAIGNTIPSKLTGYMSASKMVIAAIDGDSRKIINESKCGIFTDPDDYHKLASIIDEYYSHYDLYKDYGKNGRKYFEKYCTLDVFMNKLDDIFMKFKKEEK